MADRTLADVDLELSDTVKARDIARSTISQLSLYVVEHTRFIDKLLAERSRMLSNPNSTPPRWW